MQGRRLRTAHIVQSQPRQRTLCETAAEYNIQLVHCTELVGDSLDAPLFVKSAGGGMSAASAASVATSPADGSNADYKSPGAAAAAPAHRFTVVPASDTKGVLCVAEQAVQISPPSHHLPVTPPPRSLTRIGVGRDVGRAGRGGPADLGA